MARKRVIVKSILHSWDDVNETLRKIAEKKSGLEAKVALYNEDEARRRKELDKFCNPIRTEIEQLEEEMKLFCEDHREDFGKLKTKELPNGPVGFRLSPPKVKTLRGFTFKAVLNLIKRSIYKDKFIRIKEEINREQIITEYQAKNINSDNLSELGIQINQEETFGYDIHIASEQKTEVA